MPALLAAMRPRHWIKNAFVAAPLLFAGLWDQAWAWIATLASVAAFCLLSSSVYLINDLCDRRADQAHPVKRNRPIASGRIRGGEATAAAVFLAAGAFAVLAAVVPAMRGRGAQPPAGLGLLVWGGLYFALNLLYSLWLKRLMIVDVLVVALGFVLRAMAGAAAIAVPISPWLVVCTLTLCLFIALAKRRGEIAEMPEGRAADARSVHRGYTPEFLEHMLTVSAAMAILTYCLYCLSPWTVARIGSANMVWTIPLVVYGTFRYYRLTLLARRSDPVRLLIRDRAMWAVLIAYALLSAAVIRYGSHAGVQDILDTTLRP
jgi:4-hydroxybenzoate polyprenyltransferase